MNDRRFEVLTVGEAMVRLAASGGDMLETAARFDAHVGGSEANVAVALARIGRKVAWMSRVADDPLGRRVIGELRRHGVSCEPVAIEPGGRTGLYFTDLGGAPRGVTVHYDRRGSAASLMSVANMDVAWVEQASVVELSGITPGLSDSCAELTTAVVEVARRAACTIVVDVNYRSRLWSVDEARPVITELCRAADVVLCTAEDASHLFGIDRPDAKALTEVFETATVVLTDGAAGVSWHAPDGAGSFPAIATDTVDRLGAGDAFCAGVITGLLDGDLASGIRRGQAMASLARTMSGDLFVGTSGDVAAVLATDGRADRR